jgi:hypothetical protein
MKERRSWWLNFTAYLLYILGALHGLSALQGICKLTLLASLPVGFTSRPEVIWALQKLAAQSAFRLLFSVAFVISGFGCIKKRAYQGRFLGTACGLQMFALDFVSIYIL